MTVSLEKEIAEDLITYKMRRIEVLISEILSRWNETSVDAFLKKVRDGTYPEAENDAIELRQLLLEDDKLRKLLKKIT